MRTLAFIFAPTILVGAGFAQSFNIDVGEPGSPTHWTPLPSSSFAAAAGQPGVWTTLDPSIGIATAMTDVTGAATSVTMTRTGGSTLSGHLNAPNLTGDDWALLGDYEAAPNQPFQVTWTLSNLLAGTYSVYTYAFSVLDTHTGVSVNGGLTTSVGGSWTGAYVQGVTHAVDTVNVAGGGSITIQFTFLSGPVAGAFFNGLQLVRNTSASSFCLGDGTGAVCPCGNSGAAGRGCANSVYPGSFLAATGLASLANDTLVLTATDLAAGTAFYFQSTGIGPALPYGDGLLCAHVGIQRLGPAFGTSVVRYPMIGTPNLLSIDGGPLNPGDVRHYQTWCRDVGAFCTPGTYNMTQGLTLTWEQ